MTTKAEITRARWLSELDCGPVAAAALAAAQLPEPEREKEMAEARQVMKEWKPNNRKLYGADFFAWRAALELVQFDTHPNFPKRNFTQVLCVCGEAAPSVFALNCLNSCRGFIANYSAVCCAERSAFMFEQGRSSCAPACANDVGGWTARFIDHFDGGTRKFGGLMFESPRHLAGVVCALQFLAADGWLIAPAAQLSADDVAALLGLFATATLAPTASGVAMLICRGFAKVSKPSAQFMRAQVERGRPPADAAVDALEALVGACRTAGIVEKTALIDNPLRHKTCEQTRAAVAAPKNVFTRPARKFRTRPR